MTKLRPCSVGTMFCWNISVAKVLKDPKIIKNRPIFMETKTKNRLISTKKQTKCKFYDKYIIHP